MRSLAWVGLGLALIGRNGDGSGGAQAGADRPASTTNGNDKHRGPEHGYSGWVPGAGRRGLYCDYQRIPNRECTVSASGNRRCRATSWTLKQYCY